MKTTRPTAKRSIYQAVTDRRLASLKAGVIPWEQPWHTPRFAGGPFPRNFRTRKPYRGVNVFLLWASPYPSPFWLTLGGTVRKGEKGTPIVFYKPLRSPATEEATATVEQDRPPFVLCNYTAFNVEQCDGLTLPQLEPPTNDVDKDETCESIVNGWENPTRPSPHKRNRNASVLPPQHRLGPHARSLPLCGYAALLQHPLSRACPQHRSRKPPEPSFSRSLWRRALHQRRTTRRNGSRFPLCHCRHRQRAHRPQHHGLPPELDGKARTR